MTRKTGNFKRFPVFVEMLVTGIKQVDLESFCGAYVVLVLTCLDPTAQASPTVSLDLLTHEDLLALKTSSKKPYESKQENQSRFYLILTYAVAFDRLGVFF